MKSFCISLEKNKDKWGEIIDKIHKVGFDDVDIFPGVNGKEIGELSKGNPVSENTKKIVDSLGGISNLLSPWVRYFLAKGLNRKDHSQIPTWGGVGCYLSHVLIWMKMIEDNLPYCVIFEDDVQFSANFETEFKNRMEMVPADADVVFLGVVNNFIPEKTNKYFNKINGLFFGLHAYIMTNRGARKLLKNVFPIEVQLDSNMAFSAFLDSIKLYETWNLCTQSTHFSSIQTKCLVCDVNENKISFLLIIYFVMIFLIIFFIITRLYNARV